LFDTRGGKRVAAAAPTKLLGEEVA